LFHQRGVYPINLKEFTFKVKILSECGEFKVMTGSLSFGLLKNIPDQIVSLSIYEL
jgi:hypothetical protein